MIASYPSEQLCDGLVIGMIDADRDALAAGFADKRRGLGHSAAIGRVIRLLAASCHIDGRAGLAECDGDALTCSPAASSPAASSHESGRKRQV